MLVWFAITPTQMEHKEETLDAVPCLLPLLFLNPCSLLLMSVPFYLVILLSSSHPSFTFRLQLFFHSFIPFVLPCLLLFVFPFIRSLTSFFSFHFTNILPLLNVCCLFFLSSIHFIPLVLLHVFSLISSPPHSLSPYLLLLFSPVCVCPCRTHTHLCVCDGVNGG